MTWGCWRTTRCFNKSEKEGMILLSLSNFLNYTIFGFLQRPKHLCCVWETTKKLSATLIHFFSFPFRCWGYVMTWLSSTLEQWTKINKATERFSQSIRKMHRNFFFFFEKGGCKLDLCQLHFFMFCSAVKKNSINSLNESEQESHKMMRKFNLHFC